MRNLLKIFLFTFISVFVGCNNAPACTDMSWSGEAKADYFQPDVLYSAGDQCENYNDYFDEDINVLIDFMGSMRMVLDENDTCNVDGEWTECPEEVAREIEFKSLYSCQFSTPPDKNTDCDIGPIVLWYQDYTKYNDLRWRCEGFDESDPLKTCTLFFSGQDFNVSSRFYEDSSGVDTRTIYMTYKWGDNKEFDLKYNVQ